MIQGRRPPVGGRWWMASRHYKCLSTALFLWALAVTTAIHQAEDGDCCRYAPTPCRTACHQVPLWQLSGEERDQHLAHLTASCPAHLEEYWTCVNKTLAGMMEGVGWWGRPCCRLALAPACQAACLRAHHAPQLAPACRPSHEIDLFECVRRTEQGAGCCARTQSYKCRTSCEAVFAARSPSRRLRHQLARDCHAHTYVTSCARFLTRTTPAHRPESKLHCCAASESSSCRATCRAVLTSEAPQQDILDQLEESCGIVDLTVGVWTCLFRHSDAAAPEVRQVSNLVRLGLDAGKLSCCSRAVSLECRGLCGRAFSTEWGRAWDALHTSCLTRPEEAALLSCLGEADTPCQQGCSGLAFCTNFNHRPNDLFRSCNARADEAAEKDLRLWEDSLTLTLPGLAAAVPLKSVSECEPELWRAVACTLHLRPCHVATLTNTICWQDCVRLLSRCMREPGSSSSSTGLGGEGSATPTTAASVCSALSPPPGSPCVSITGFLTPSPLPNEPPWRVPTSPCRPDPCPPRHLCSVNPQCGPGRPCPPYLCTPACTLGEVSSVAVPVGAFVSIPSSSETSRCGRLCECGGAGALERCRYLACVEPAPCWLGTSKFEHATEVVVGCRLCACHAGELTCVPRPNCDLQLLNTLPPSMGMSAGMVSRSLRVGTTGAGEAIEGLPCGCLDHWVPVCAADGRTFPSECLARCAGVKEGLWVEGECGLQDVCGGVKCGRGEKCIPAPATCLTLPTTKCPQHICVPLSGECPGEASIRACDTQRRQHQSLCELVRAGGTLAHLGNCSIQAASANISPRGGTLVQGLYYENPQRVRFSGAAVAIPLTYELDNFIGTVDLDTVEKTLLNMAPLMKSKFPDLGNSVTFSTYVQELKFRTTNVVRVIRKVKWELDKLNYISVSKSKPQRNKRGLINLMGEISKTLFGTATDTDLADVRNMVNRLTSKVEEQEFLNDKIISATAAAVDKLNTNVQHIVDHVNDLTHFINSLSVDFKHFADFTLLLENLTLMASDLRSNIMSFKAGLALLDTGVLDPFLFPPDIMVEVVQKLVTLGYNVPSPPTYTHNQLYDIVRVQASHPQYNAISVVLLIPILEHPMFNIRRVHSVPTFMSESVTTAWESYPVLISTGTQSLATHLTHWPDCTHGVCYGSLNLASPTEICEAAVLFLNSTTTCARTMTRRNSKTAFKRVTGGYFYSVAPSASLTLRQVCINDSIQIPLKGDGYLPAQAGCSYVGHHTYLSASGVVNVAGQQPIAFQPPFSLSKPVLDLNEKAIPEDFLAPLMADDVPVPEAQLRALHQLAALPSGPHWRLSTYGGLSASTTALVLIFGAIAVAILLYCRLRRRLPPSPSPQTAQRSAEFALSSLRFGRGLQDLRSLRSGHEEPSLDPHVYASVAHSVNEATNNYD